MSYYKPTIKPLTNEDISNKESKDLVDAFGKEIVEKAIRCAPTIVVKRELETVLRQAEEYEKAHPEEFKSKGSDCGASVVNL
jgi:hypothetical protein